MSSKYHHLTAADRYTICAMRKSKYSQRQIAKVLGVHVSTISRELQRNTSFHGYRFAFAERQAGERRRICRKPFKMTADTTSLVVRLLRQQWSPEQISGRLHKTNELHISKETIYKFIRKDRCAGGKLYRHLRHPGKYRKRGSGKKVQTA